VNEFWGVTIGEINDQATSLHHEHKQQACELENLFLKIFRPHGKLFIVYFVPCGQNIQ
jgi:hypothetical protein